MANEFQRFTTAYNETEDRIALIGELADGTSVLVWLTRRALLRLVPVVVEWLTQQGGDTPRAELLHEFAQQSARAGLEPQAPVQAKPDSRAWVAHTVDIARDPAVLGLTFRCGDEHGSLMLGVLPARQWLNIVHDVFVTAEWPAGDWPAWLSEGAQVPAAPALPMLH